MFSGCMYQKLDSLLPPVVPANVQNSSPGTTHHDFPRLFHISACVIMRDEDTARCLLPLTPAMFFKPLLQAAILNNFYNKDRRLKLVPGSLVQLILHWPHESFVLRELLPPLPPRNFNRFSQFNSLDLIEDELQKFYEEIILVLPSEVIRSRSVNTPTDEWKLSQIKKIDVSGYLPMCTPSFYWFDPTYYNYLDKLLASVKAAYNPNCSSLVYDKKHKIEIICDVIINAAILENLHLIINTTPKLEYLHIGAITEINCQPGAHFSVTFRKVGISSDSMFPLNNNEIVSLLDMFYKNGTEFIELNMYEVGDEITTHFNPQLKGLYLESMSKITSLDFLKSMSDLQQLKVANVDLRDKLMPLCCLP